MSYSAEQIEQGRLKAVAGNKSRKFLKKSQHRRLRRKIKSDPDYVAHFNRYSGWEL